jgi:lipopolysaccharide transport system ATP-binding protein
MSDVVIKVEDLGKKYVLNQARNTQEYKSIRDAISNQMRSITKGLLGNKRTKTSCHEEFWALKNIYFEVKQGDRVGIIGRNGAGKSTLLKVLSRITDPSSGFIRINGRVASLLEVGTGFHPELTGRENIYLNGAILGMSKLEIQQKFDEIVAFAEVEKFLDTPVKRYSSGMYVRLAFAVAAHLEPEVLIIDEVLAVGDMQFQKKCLGKMQDVSREGRTILFVSHNMSIVESLCNRSILLNSGTVSLNGTAQEGIQQYLEQAYSVSTSSLSDRRDRSGTGKVKATSVKLLDSDDMEVSSLQSGKSYNLEVGYLNQSGQLLNDVIVSLDFLDEKNNRVMLLRTNFTNENLNLEAGSGLVRCNVQNIPLASGLYRLSVYFGHTEAETMDYIEDAASVTVDGGDFFGTGSPGLPSHCKILSKASWYTGATSSVPIHAR